MILRWHALRLLKPNVSVNKIDVPTQILLPGDMVRDLDGMHYLIPENPQRYQGSFIYVGYSLVTGKATVLDARTCVLTGRGGVSAAVLARRQA